MRKLIHFALLICLAYSEVKGQDASFSQFYGSPLYLNPAFAGSTRCPRLVLNYRDQWPSIPGTFVTGAASYDQYVDAIRGGVGILLMNDRAGQSVISTTSVSGMYSYQLDITKDVAARLGINATYAQKRFDWQSMLLGDNIDQRFGFVLDTKEDLNNLKKPIGYFDFGAGFIVYSNKAYGGVSVAHLTQPSEAFINTQQDARLPRKITVHGGFIHVLGKDKKMSQSYISPNMLFQMQGNFNLINVGMYYARGPLVTGVWYRSNVGKVKSLVNSDALILLVGVQSGMYRIGYSYDYTISKLGNTTGGSHEISLGLQFACLVKKKKLKTIKCPVF